MMFKVAAIHFQGCSFPTYTFTRENMPTLKNAEKPRSPDLSRVS